MAQEQGGPCDAVRVAECDIDSLLVEELSTSPAFVTWVVDQVALQTNQPCWNEGDQTVEAVRPHVYEPGDGAGETDLLVQLLATSTAGHERRRLLIEDKICSPFTVQQPQRYRTRSQAAVESGGCTRCATVLVAPERYLSTPGAELFDVRITFEQLADYFRQREDWADGTTAERHRERRGTIERAIEAAKAGYVMEVDEVNTDFWRAYRSYMAEHAPSLRSKASQERGRWALDVYYEPLPGLKGWNIKHSLQNSRVMIELLGWGPFLSEVREVIEPVLDPDMSLGHALKSRTPGTTIHIGIDVPRVDTQVPFEQQVNRAKAGLDAAVRLQTWCLKNRAILVELTSRVASLRKALRQRATIQ